MQQTHLENVIVKHYAGSISYGTNTPQSDTDFRGIFCADKEFILSPFNPVREVNDTAEEDTKLYELSNFMKLYMDANPNILETLWVRPEHVVQGSPEYDLMVQHRGELLSKRVANTFTGFAIAQAKRLKNHNSWIAKEMQGVQELQEIINREPSIQLKEWIEESFPDIAVNQLDFKACKYYIKSRLKTEVFMKSHALQMLSTKPLQHKYFIKMVHNYTDNKVFARDFDIDFINEGHMMYPYGSDIYAVLKSSEEHCLNDDGSIREADLTKYPPEKTKELPLFILKYCKDEYTRSYDNRTNYHTWRKNRNPARAELEFEHGYDTKFAMHTIRILRMAEEILSTGELIVYRPDAQELLDIRNGKWKYEEVMQYQEDKIHLIEDVLYKSTALPKFPNQALATKLLVDIREMRWYSKRN